MRLSPKARLDARRRAQDDLWFLATEILGWGDLGFLDERLHKPLCRWIEKSDVPAGPGLPTESVNKTRMLLFPRYHGKTTLFTVADDIRLQLRHPGLCIAIGHDTVSEAATLMSQIKSAFEECDLLKQIAPDICFENPQKQSAVWTKSEFLLKRKVAYRVSSFVAVAPDAMPTGLHFDVWNWDDLVTWENSRTHTQRQRCKDAFDLAKPFLPATRMGYRKVAGTRWHMDDLYGDIERKQKESGADVYIGNMLAPDGQPWLNKKFCVELAGPDDKRITIAKLMGDMGGSAKFHACMMNDPLPEGTAAFKRDDVQLYRLNAVERKDWAPPVLGLQWEFFTAVDLNTQSHTAGDFAVVMTVAKSNQGHLAVVDVSRGHPTRLQLVEWVERHNLAWQPRAIFVEVVAYQKTFVGDLAAAQVKSGDRMPVTQVNRGGARTGNSKNDRIMSLQGVVEMRKLWVPDADRFAFLVEEIVEFAAESDSRHDDGLDCLADVHMLGRKPDGPVTKSEPLSNDRLLTDWFMQQLPRGLDEGQEGSERIEW